MMFHFVYELCPFKPIPSISLAPRPSLRRPEGCNGRRQRFKITTVRTAPTLEVDELISILSTERLVPYDCVTIVDASVRAGRNTEATTWARHNLATLSGAQRTAVRRS